MKPETLTLGDLTILEADAFRRAGIALLDGAISVLEDHRFVSVPGKGLARLLDLLSWRAGAHCEHIDGRGIFADQAVHFAIHRVLDDEIGSMDPYAVLLAECVSSASDIYLLGKLSRAGEETDFLRDTVESICSYYELYAAEPEHIEALFSSFLENPFGAMARTVGYLFEIGSALLDRKTDMTRLRELTQNPLYPLVHHYNLSNWLLTIRARFGDRADENPETSAESMAFLTDEASFLGLFRIHGRDGAN